MATPEAGDEPQRLDRDGLIASAEHSPRRVAVGWLQAAAAANASPTFPQLIPNLFRPLPQPRRSRRTTPRHATLSIFVFDLSPALAERAIISVPLGLFSAFEKIRAVALLPAGHLTFSTGNALLQSPPTEEAGKSSIWDRYDLSREAPRAVNARQAFVKWNCARSVAISSR